MAIYTSADHLIGHTPLLRLSRIEKELGLQARLLAKLEMRNPAGSVKDRVACAMLDEAEAGGRIKPGATIIEPTSGNTGIGICAVAAVRGYKAIIVMPDSMSKERVLLMEAYGARVVLTPGALGMKGAIAKAEELHGQIENSFIPGQFENPANPLAHFDTTGPEIFSDTEGEIDCFVCGVGTGGTLTGVGRYLKSRNSDIRIIGVEPADSPYLSQGRAGAHGIQGIGAGFLPAILDTSLLDEVLTVTTEQSYEAARMLARKEAILPGISSGAALCGAIQVASRPEMEGKTVVVLLPDGGEKYLSTDLFRKSN